MDKPLWGLRVQAPYGARVQKVQKVQRVVAGRLLIDRRRPLMKKTYNRLAGVGKQANRPGGRGNAFPLWWLAPPPFPLFEGALWVLSNGAMSLQEGIERFILSLGWGKVRRSWIGGRAQRLISRMLIIPYDIESQSRNADFKNCGEAATTTL